MCIRRKSWSRRLRRPSSTPTAHRAAGKPVEHPLGAIPATSSAARRWSRKTPRASPARASSSLLERRPDLRNAEQLLVAANADIGQAKAAFYPQVTLTGFWLPDHRALRPFHRRSKTWQFGPAVTLSLFAGWTAARQLKLAEARFQGSVALYKNRAERLPRSVRRLIAYQRTREFRDAAGGAHAGSPQRDRPGQHALRGGVTSYLEVLYDEQELFTAELGLAQARRDEFLSVVHSTAPSAAGGPDPPRQPNRPLSTRPGNS